MIAPVVFFFFILAAIFVSRRFLGARHRESRPPLAFFSPSFLILGMICDIPSTSLRVGRTMVTFIFRLNLRAERIAVGNWQP